MDGGKNANREIDENDAKKQCVLKNEVYYFEFRLQLARNSDNQHVQELNLVTALVPSVTACLASSPGRRRRTAAWTSREERVCFLL